MNADSSSTDLLLFSGGMDSISIAYWTRPAIALTVDYGQRSARGEMRAARAIAAALHLKHDIIHIDARSLGSGDLAGTSAHAVAPVPEWWPFRNQLLVTIAAARAIHHGCHRVIMGTVATDGAHADGTQEFVRAMDAVLSLQEGQIRLEAPALKMTTQELILRSEVPPNLLAWAHSCHRSDRACGACRGCTKYLDIRREVWGESATW